LLGWGMALGQRGVALACKVKRGGGGSTENTPPHTPHHQLGSTDPSSAVCIPDGQRDAPREGCSLGGMLPAGAQHRPEDDGSQCGPPVFCLPAPSGRGVQPPGPPLTAVEALLLQQGTEDLALQGAEVPQAAQLLCQLRVGQRQVHPAAGTKRHRGRNTLGPPTRGGPLPWGAMGCTHNKPKFSFLTQK